MANQSDFGLSTDGDLTILTLKTSAEALFFVPKSEYDKLKEKYDAREEMFKFGQQCYQDRCEGALIEVSVMKKLEEENQRLNLAWQNCSMVIQRMSRKTDIAQVKSLYEKSKHLIYSSILR